MMFERRDTGLLQRYKVMGILPASLRQFFYHNRPLLFHTAIAMESQPDMARTPL